MASKQFTRAAAESFVADLPAALRQLTDEERSEVFSWLLAEFCFGCGKVQVEGVKCPCEDDDR